ncbi:phage tail sheath family protein [Derxia lacustris]|uniref:phage tail sheath family protein n=1 Tax=Derxia lacustris TaxID=764842 RepID=UPI000A17663C|nr:phage tail sheath subtilisin-like domain-containing protein [Derxia lacustris]
MPEYLAPGVFVEEVSFRSKSIEGVSTTTTGFIGPARFGPVTEASDILTSLTEYERAYDAGSEMAFGPAGDITGPNFLWHGLRAFFEEGGKRAYVSRVFRPLAAPVDGGLEAPFADVAIAGSTPLKYGDGHGRATVGSGDAFRIVARWPGSGGNLRARFGIKLGPNLLGALPDPDDASQLVPTVSNLADGDVVWISSAAAYGNDVAPSSPPAPRGVDQLPIYVAKKLLDGTWNFIEGGIRPGSPPQPADPNAILTLADFNLDPQPGSGDAIRPLTLSLEVLSDDGTRSLGAWSGLSLSPSHKTAGVPDSIFDLFSLDGAASAGTPIVLLNDVPGGVIGGGTDLLRALDALKGIDFALTPAEWQDANFADELGALRRKLERGLSGVAWLEGGNDGLLPGRAEYEGRADPTEDFSTGLKQLEAIEDISIVAAPGATWKYESRVDDVNSVINLLIAHAERMRYRIAVLDTPEGMKIADVRKLRAKIDSKHAALYWPWVTVFDPITRLPLNLPPSGFVAGIFARNDTERAVYKAPANEVVRGAIGFETMVSAAQQEVLNPEGINVFRFFEGRGFRLWGARTISSDPEWKYVNVRRYFAYLERSIDKGTQWAVFEPNGEALWANVRATVRDFLVNEWAGGALLGDKPEKAFFVRCDRSTMTQNDLDNGRLVCLIGVAPLKPAEFVIFRIGQWTADQKN